VEPSDVSMDSLWIRSWRFGAKLRTIVRRGIECHQLLRENHSRLSVVEAAKGQRRFEDLRQHPQRRCRVQATLPRDQKCRHALAAKHRVDGRHGAVCDSVRRAFSGIGAMIRAAQSSMKTTERAVAINRQTRWHEYGGPASPVKAGLRPPSAASGLDRACCPAIVGHRAFDGGLRLMQEHTTFQPSRKPLTQNI
jgi:hypothetical protein